MAVDFVWVYALSLLGLSLRYLKIWAVLGIFFTVYLWYIEIFKIGAICPLCLLAYVFDYIIVLLLFFT
jgi:uncharacterized membrane protein